MYFVQELYSSLSVRLMSHIQKSTIENIILMCCTAFFNGNAFKMVCFTSKNFKQNLLIFINVYFTLFATLLNKLVLKGL